MDRRVRRTRAMLGQALKELLLEKDYDAITVQDITDRADLNRATFYLHYGRKEVLLTETLETQFDELIARIEAETAGQYIWENPLSAQIVYEHIAEHAALYKVLFGERGQGFVINRLLKYMARYDENQLRQVISEEGVPVALVAYHFAGALFATAVWWLENDMPYSPEYMADNLQRLCASGVVSLAGVDVMRDA
ncbi:MAG TPA: TetR/AcrR family transcriptional regulator [Anaerolineae bacterium]|nr:TetR/AcrR family transcriptional regulator [Anaerolineae bacterium]